MRPDAMGLGDLAGDLRATFGVAAGDDDALGAGRGQPAGDGRAQALRRAGDDADLAVHAVHCTTSYPAAAMTRSSSLWPFFAISSGGETLGSCSASTTNQPS
jgi:hypothetical protein